MKRLPLGTALKESFLKGYSFSDLKADLSSGTVVGLVALPLGLALALAVGVGPEQGLATVIVAGLLVALLGGSRFQVTGPTAAFVVILVPVVKEHGMEGLLIAGIMSGLFLMVMGFMRMGRLIQYIPYPVTVGFTVGIAASIAVIQLKDFLGLSWVSTPETLLERIQLLWQSLPEFRIAEFLLGLTTLVILFFWPRISRKIPGPLVALSLVGLGAYGLQMMFPEFHYQHLLSQFGGIPQEPPRWVWPWNFPSETGSPEPITWAMIQSLIPSAMTIALLAAIESLLSAVVADSMTQTKHDPDSELVALGIGNVVTPFFGGIPATGAIARTATNIRFGARSPLSAITHSLVVLAIVLLAAPVISYLPLAALAALLMMVAYHMADLPHVMRILKVAPRADAGVFLTCALLTFVFDMVLGVAVGIVLAALLFMRRMSELTDGHFLEAEPSLSTETADSTESRKCLVYEIKGPLFFGATQMAIQNLSLVQRPPKSVVFDLSQVPVMDMTGLVAFESAVLDLKRQKKEVALVGLQGGVKELCERSEILKDLPRFSNATEAKNSLNESPR
jgi:SulP family sulfate permease